MNDIAATAMSKGHKGTTMTYAIGLPRVILVTHRNVQSQLFSDYIATHLDCTVTTVAAGELSDTVLWPVGHADPEDAQVILIDADHTSDDEMRSLQDQVSTRPDVQLAVINLQHDDHAIRVLSFLHLRGIFYRQDSLEIISKGIGCLSGGSLWMPRRIMTRLIEFFRRQQLNSYRPANGLTQREMEILGLIGAGASNQQIATELFVSEHTVKSHIYNIFKKLKVNNRLQASNWAREHLGAPPPGRPSDRLGTRNTLASRT